MEIFSKVYNQVLATHDDYIYKNSIAIDALWEPNICALIAENINLIQIF